jgi:hypothetical protein
VGFGVVSARCCGTLCFMVFWLGGVVFAQAPVGRTSGSSAASTSTPLPDASTAQVSRTVTGRVVNALTGAPVPRALVNLNSRSVLTDSLGQFTFPVFTERQGYIGATKPGYSQNQDATDGPAQMKAADLDSPVEIRIYPNALITGVVRGSDGLPLSRIPMRLRRLVLDTSGARWVSAGFTITDVHGNYRFLVPAGRYRVSTTYTARSVERGEAVLPAAFPSTSSDPESDYFSVGSGEERQVDLQPRMGTAYTVRLKVENSDVSRGIRLSATTQGGLTFNLPVQPGSDNNQMEVSLPAGTYTLRGVGEASDSAAEGFVRLTVTGDSMAAVPLRLVPTAQFPVEVIYEPSATSQGASVQQVSVRNLNLHFHNRESEGDADNPDSRLSSRPDEPAEFHLHQGRFRLSGNAGGAWYVRAATCGATDLLRDDLVVSSGAAGSPIRLVLSNASGSLHGNTGAQAGSAWIYLVPEEPGIMPAYEFPVQQDGSFRWSGPPGKYAAVALNHRVREDFSRPDRLKSLLAGSTTVDVASGGDAAIDLSVKTMTEAAQ